MSTAIRDVVVRIRLEQQEAKLAKPDSRLVDDEIARIRREYQDAFKAPAGGSPSRSPASPGRGESLGDVPETARRAEESMRRLDNQNLKSAASMIKVGEGAFHIARGIAFMSASSDEDLRKMIQRISAAQGAFDLFKGAVQLTQGVAAIATAANAALATSNVAVATTSGAAAVGMTALNTAMGPLGIAFLGIGAAVTALSFAFSQADESSDDLLDDMPRKIRSATEEFKALAQARAAFEIGRGGRNEDVAAARQDVIGLEARLTELRREIPKRESDLFDFSLNAVRTMGQTAAGSLAANPNDQSGMAAMEAALRAAERSASKEESRLSTLKEMRQIQHDLVAAARDELEAKMKVAEAAEAALKTEQERLSDIEREFGAASQRERRQVTAISERAAAGQAPSQREEEFLRRVVPSMTTSMLDELAKKRGADAGAIGVAERFAGKSLTGDGSRLEELRLKTVGADGRPIKDAVTGDLATLNTKAAEAEKGISAAILASTQNLDGFRQSIDEFKMVVEDSAAAVLLAQKSANQSVVQSWHSMESVFNEMQTRMMALESNLKKRKSI